MLNKIHSKCICGEIKIWRSQGSAASVSSFNFTSSVPLYTKLEKARLGFVQVSLRRGHRILEA